MIRKALIIISCLLLSFAGQAVPNKISQFNVNIANGYYVSFMTTAKPDYSSFLLKNPARYVVDFNNASQHFTPSSSIFAGSPIKDMRVAKKLNHGLRLVFDLHIDSKVISSVSKVSGKYPYKVSFKFIPSKSKQYWLPTKKTTAVKAVASPKKKTKKLRNIVIVLDPGHGGRDPGATGPRGTYEKHVVLKIGLNLRRDLQKIPGIKVYMTRSSDVYPTLSQRLYLARKVKADLFISIHADAFKRRSARGATVFALSRGRATSEAARWIAERENKSELLGGVELSDKSYTLRSVLVDLSQTATIGSSLKLGRNVANNLMRITRMHSKRVEQASLYVLTSPDIPAILIETGFISNPTEERLLNTRSHRVKIAKAIASGIKKYLVDNPIQNTIFTATMFGGKYIVKSGDTLSGIAAKFKVSSARIKAVNTIKHGKLYVGQVIRIPAKTR